MNKKHDISLSGQSYFFPRTTSHLSYGYYERTPASSAKGGSPERGFDIRKYTHPPGILGLR